MEQQHALADAVGLTQSILDGGPFADGGAPSPCPAFTVDELVDHAVWAHDLLTGAAGGEPTPDGPPRDRLAAAGELAVKTWQRRGADGTVQLGPNEMPATVVLAIHIVETYVHAWDLAMATGREFTPAPELTAAAGDAARTFLTDDVRGTDGDAPFGPKRSADGGASSVDQLIAFTGRDPTWVAPRG
jgi:uncharacterized protein (TIGR03086 family)